MEASLLLSKITEDNTLILRLHPHREMRALADKYNALVFLDECHASGFLGNSGRCVWSPYYICGVNIIFPMVEAVSLSLHVALGVPQ